MERYEQLFTRLQERKEGAFVPFVTLGDPSPEQSLKIIDALIEGGADALEPAARARVAAQLVTALEPFVSPLPEVDPETLVRATAAVRRDREYRALMLENERAAALTAPR